VGEPDTSSSEFGLGRVKVRDPVDEHMPLTVQMLGEEQGGSLSVSRIKAIRVSNASMSYTILAPSRST
jgi:hypothetical protein